MTSIPQPWNPRASLVATWASRERAIAAIWQSAWLIGRQAARLLAEIAAKARAARLSNGMMRPANNTPKALSAASVKPERRVPCGKTAMPVRTSASVTAVTNKVLETRTETPYWEEGFGQ